MAIKRYTSATLWWLLCIALAVILTVVFLFPLFRKKKQREAELKNLQSKEMIYQLDRSQLSESVTQLENSPEAVNRLARDKFLMAGPDEKILVVEENPKK